MQAKENVKQFPAYEREQTWLGLAIALAIISLVCGGFVVLWILQAGNEDAMLTRSRIATPVGTIFIAAITFCTVVWRGIVGTRQADEQQRANDAKDEENTAKLLIEGTKLLSEEQTSHKVAGIASLQSVALDKHEKFTIPAMDILMDVIAEHYDDEDKRDIYLAARRAAKAGHDKGQRSSRDVTIDMTRIPRRPIPRILGAARLKIIGGNISRSAYDRFVKETAPHFERTSFVNAKLGDEARLYRNCTFVRCIIGYITREFIAENSFENCDFSGAKVSYTLRQNASETLVKLKGKGNFYKPNSPPEEKFEIVWSDFLDEKRNFYAGAAPKGRFPGGTSSQEEQH